MKERYDKIKEKRATVSNMNQQKAKMYDRDLRENIKENRFKADKIFGERLEKDKQASLRDKELYDTMKGAAAELVLAKEKAFKDYLDEG